MIPWMRSSHQYYFQKPMSQISASISVRLVWHQRCVVSYHFCSAMSFFPFLFLFSAPASHEYSRQAAVHGVHARAPVVRQVQYADKTELLHEPELHDVGGSGVQHDGPTR